MSLAHELGAPPQVEKVASIIKRYAAALELGPDWATAAAVRILAEVGLYEALRTTEKVLAPSPPTVPIVQIVVKDDLTTPDPGEVP